MCMTSQEQINRFLEKIVADLCRIDERPDGWLPHTVFVEEEAADGYPCYVRYEVEDYLPDGSCTLHNPLTGERETDRHLREINIDWLVTLWRRYMELCIEQGLWRERAIHLLERKTDAPLPDILEFVGEHWQNCASDEENIEAFRRHTGLETSIPNTELYAFVWNSHHMDRTVSDEEILRAWEEGPSLSKTDPLDNIFYEVEKLTPDELAERINDDMFNEVDSYVRFIETPE